MDTNPPNEPLNLENLRERLLRLGLHGLLANVETVINEPWLRQVLAIEEAERSRRSFQRRLKAARLQKYNPMAGFEWTWPTQCDRPLVEELFSLSFIEEPANIVLIGPNGIGKTMIAKNLLHQAIMHGHTARFTLASDMLHDLAAPRTPRSRSRAACVAIPARESSRSMRSGTSPTTRAMRTCSSRSSRAATRKTPSSSPRINRSANGPRSSRTPPAS